MSPRQSGHFHVVIVGAGFSGLGMAIRLRQEGQEDFVILERAGEVGGVWRDNSYPGCACDVPSHLYSFSFVPNPRWSRAYSPQGEIHAYLRDCVERFGLRPFLRFHHTVEEARWDDDAQVWRLQTSEGAFTANVFIFAAGAFGAPLLPALPGLERFQGKVMHSARWDHAYPLEGRKVAVVGTGASAIQFVPAIQPQVGQLVLFQRTPPWVMPRKDHPITRWAKWLYTHVPGARWLVRAFLYSTYEASGLAFLHPWLIRLAQRRALRHLERSVEDPALRAKLRPRYTMGCKRVLISDDYLRSLTRDNVRLVTDGVREVREHSLVTEQGVEHPVDTLIFGTGFHITDAPFAHHIRGRDGRTLSEHWAGSMKAHLGTTVAGFPNFFMLLGPNTGLGHTSVILMVESQLSHVLHALRFLDGRNLAAVEPTQEAQDAYVRDLDERMRGTVWSQGGCVSWYMDATGRNSTLWPGLTFAFKHRVARFEPSEYHAIARRTRGPATALARVTRVVHG
ncbi:NAD(P)/FAD-dependent oxidoreductase [Myxococcus sp. K15C18031901]|uniref:flavin-containing monooxygenase n=1 Tax=Myxococcus dinghuensis TaxID=2906761 RepID=UPI0020A7F55C|nr:NAD(P)/FAD-dependent oxidoreductase [Myxococcus dinghuensis]MCP3100563.1 NAD(P)/FAD-dependent oxidoreductase [Myxococcus dinghuensis]